MDHLSRYRVSLEIACFFNHLIRGNGNKNQLIPMKSLLVNVDKTGSFWWLMKLMICIYYIHIHIMLHIIYIYIIPGGIISDHIKEFHEFPFFWALPNKNKSTLFFLSAEFFSPVFFFGPIHRPLIGAFFINKKFSGFRSR